MGLQNGDPPISEKVVVSEMERVVCLSIAVAKGVPIDLQTDCVLKNTPRHEVVNALKSLSESGLVSYETRGNLVLATLLIPFNQIDIDRSPSAIAKRLFKASDSPTDSRRRLLPFITPKSTARIDFLGLRQMVSENSDWFRMKAQSLEYCDFLLTPYWAIVSDRVKMDCGNSCVLCGTKDDLQAHHRAYHSKGIEILDHLKNLTCLCGKCHSNFHNNSTR